MRECVGWSVMAGEAEQSEAKQSKAKLKLKQSKAEAEAEGKCVRSEGKCVRSEGKCVRSEGKCVRSEGKWWGRRDREREWKRMEEVGKTNENRIRTCNFRI